MFIKGCKAGPGRPKKSENKSSVATVIEFGAKEAAEYLVAVANGKEKKPSSSRIDAAKYIINQTIGMPVQKSEVASKGELIIKWDGNGNKGETT